MNLWLVLSREATTEQAGSGSAGRERVTLRVRVRVRMLGSRPTGGFSGLESLALSLDRSSMSHVWGVSNLESGSQSTCSTHAVSSYVGPPHRPLVGARSSRGPWVFRELSLSVVTRLGCSSDKCRANEQPEDFFFPNLEVHSSSCWSDLSDGLLSLMCWSTLSTLAEYGRSS